MVFSNPINIATAAMEDIFERLCWLYSTMRFTTVCDGSGNHHSLSDLTELSKGKIPYPEQFANKMDYEQNTFLRDLHPKDILCTRSDWISMGRDPTTIADQRDLNGHEVFVNLQGVPVHTPNTNAEWSIRKIREFPPYLLGFSNDMIGRIMERFFEPVAPRAQTTLSWVRDLQRIEIALQNKLSQD